MATARLVEPIEVEQQRRKDEMEMVARLDDLWEEGRTHRERWIPAEMRERNRKLYRGEVGPVGNKSPRYKLNFAGAFTDRMVAQLTSSRPILRVEARKAKTRPVGRVLSKTSQLVWDDSDVQPQTKMLAASSALDGSAAMLTLYNHERDAVEVMLKNVGDVVVDPAVTIAARICSDAEYVGWREIWPLARVREQFPFRGALVKGDTMLDDLTRRADGSETGATRRPSWIRRASENREAAMERVEVRFMYVRDRQKDPAGNLYFPTGRFVMKAGEVILWDGPNVYWDGEWPIDFFEWTPDDEHPFGHSNMELLRESQLAFNALMNGTVETRLLTNFMSIIADWNALDQKGWNKMTGLVGANIFKMTARGARFEITPPPPIAADAITLAERIYTYAQIVTGCTDAMLGENPGSLQSGAAIEGLQDSASLMTAARQSRMEDFYARVGQKIVSRTFQFMSSDRVAALIGVEAATENKSAEGGDKPDAELYARFRSGFFADENGVGMTSLDRMRALRDFKFAVTPGSSSPTARRQRAMLMGELKKGGLIPSYMVLEAADVPNAREIADEGHAEMMAQAPLLAASKQMSK